MKSRFLLLDATNIAYRAFYGIAGLTDSTGRPTNAVFGFIRIIMKLRRLYKPTHQAVVFDGGMPAERLALLPTYKAQRAAMPDDLRQQLPLIDRYLDSASMAQLRIDGKEADDVLASLAVQAEKAGAEVLIATSDKDLMQVVDENVKLISSGKDPKTIGPEEVFAKTGVVPAQVVDWLALMGDVSDNIPGVPGVGRKTAARLLAQWGSLRALWEHVHQVESTKLRQALIANRDLVLRNVQMIRLQNDIDCKRSPDDFQCRSPDVQCLKSFFTEMEFHSLAREISESGMP